ncbi:aminotransferase class V-fold PLP-dependent enzyme [Mesorhizobium sp. B2-4-15]|uniref:aminotransferase class V-fold PLP-dependent enzyme n=1 Tax=Mesorhizobium sp. B2-4-15 TaxID=2589934 RepID=UPI001152C394|nr:aminotransferase class V-fold PLP-dependent enzyme [Mesorhizobium sp. B2-4-15]TPK60931.1 aminotransferase class V-fold PLP-dependent enzyme [Mesorhizobium sp. B2-4-15]
MDVSPNQGSNSSIRERLGLRPIINVAGTMTSLGASIIVPEAVAAMAEIASLFVEIDDLQRRASAVIAKATGAEAGFVTASSASGLVMSIAGAMTGAKLLAIERLPNDTADLHNEVIMQVGHLVNYGAGIDQAIRQCGAEVVFAGTISDTQRHHLDEAINERTAAAIYVVAHTTVQSGMLSLAESVEICHAKGVPVIVDAASEYDLRRFLGEGADIVVYSGHKFLGGPTSGIVAGRQDLVRAGYLQNMGIGRPMKVGKESIAGVMAALEAWDRRDHQGTRIREQVALNLWNDALSKLPGLEVRIIPDPTGNPLDRLEVAVGPASGFSAAGLVAVLAAGSPSIMVRGHHAERGVFYLDPCNLHQGEEYIVAEQITSLLRRTERPANAMQSPRKDAARILRWPD